MASKCSGAGGIRKWELAGANGFIVAIANTALHGDRAKVELLWLKNRDALLSGLPALGDGLLVHMVGHMEKLCGRITHEEAQLFSSWCTHHEEVNTV